MLTEKYRHMQLSENCHKLIYYPQGSLSQYILYLKLYT